MSFKVCVGGRSLIPLKTNHPDGKTQRCENRFHQEDGAPMSPSHAQLLRWAQLGQGRSPAPVSCSKTRVQRSLLLDGLKQARKQSQDCLKLGKGKGAKVSQEPKFRKDQWYQQSSPE